MPYQIVGQPMNRGGNIPYNQYPIQQMPNQNSNSGQMQHNLNMSYPQNPQVNIRPQPQIPNLNQINAINTPRDPRLSLQQQQQSSKPDIKIPSTEMSILDNLNTFINENLNNKKDDQSKSNQQQQLITKVLYLHYIMIFSILKNRIRKKTIKWKCMQIPFGQDLSQKVNKIELV